METCLVRLVPACLGRRILGEQRVFWVLFFFSFPYLPPKMEKNYLELKHAMLLDLPSTHQYTSRRDRPISDGRDLMLQRTQCVSYILTLLIL